MPILGLRNMWTPVHNMCIYLFWESELFSIYVILIHFLSLSLFPSLTPSSKENSPRNVMNVVM